MRRRLQRAETRPRLDVVRVLVGAAPGLVVVRRHGREVQAAARVRAPSLAVVGAAAPRRRAADAVVATIVAAETRGRVIC